MVEDQEERLSRKRPRNGRTVGFIFIHKGSQDGNWEKRATCEIRLLE